MAAIITTVCVTCRRAFDAEALQGNPPTTCSEFCRMKRRAETARNRRSHKALVADGLRYRALLAVIEDTASGLLPQD